MRLVSGAGAVSYEVDLIFSWLGKLSRAVGYHHFASIASYPSRGCRIENLNC